MLGLKKFGITIFTTVAEQQKVIITSCVEKQGIVTVVLLDLNE